MSELALDLFNAISEIVKLRKRIAELKESDKHWAGNVKVCMQLIERYESAIAELEEKQRWRVVADGELPEHDGEYWVWLEAWNIQDKRGACIYSKDYHDNNGFFNLIPVTHWMPLPKLPEVQRQ